jgi:transcription termination factor Rho
MADSTSDDAESVKPKKRSRTASAATPARRGRKPKVKAGDEPAGAATAKISFSPESAERVPETPAPAREMFAPSHAASPEPRDERSSASVNAGAATPDARASQVEAHGAPADAGYSSSESSDSAPMARDASPAADAMGDVPPSAPSHTSAGGGGDAGQGDPRPHNPNEPFWKRDKRNRRNRGKHGGGPHGGGGAPWQQHGREPKHPQQPPPPNLAPAYGDLPRAERFADLAALATTAVEIASGGGEPLFLDELYTLTLHDLTAKARQIGAAFDGVPNRKQLLAAIFKFAAEAKRPICDRGYLDLTDKGHGFVVHPKLNYRVYPEDAYVPESLVRHYGLKRGHQLEVKVEAPRDGERCPSVVRIESVMGGAPEEVSKLTPFEELVPYYPLKRILLEAPEIHKDVSMRTVDLLTPVGFGQRGLIVAPPRTGKTVLLQNMANSISHNFPETKLILLLIDERPEEVTDFKRHTKGEVVSSTFDESPESHVHCAEMVGEKARRLVEQGEHVVILLDSITRLARAYNALASNSGKIMSGGMEATALQRPKRFFGAARNIEGAGSLTIMATALIDTGSRMDEVIFEEFKGTGNMELHLDRGLVDKRIFPAINGDRSGTRKEELIYHPDEIVRVHGLRRAMQGIPPVEAMEMLISRLKKTKTNAEFLFTLNR